VLGARKVILIAGPTASGKSALAVEVARACGGIIINADASQVYADLDVLTARPPSVDLEEVEHRLYGHVDGAQAYSVGKWLDDVAAVWREAGDRCIVVVGGTGLYFDALTRGLAQMPHVPDDVRAFWRGQGDGLHDALVRRDPVMAARLRPTDRQRIIRALEVIDATGESLSVWQTRMSEPLLPEGSFTGIVLAPERAALRARIASRFARMVEEGALEEVKALVARGLDADLPVMKALGVPALAAFLKGETSIGDAVAKAVLDTGQYAKRQDTWFRNRMGHWERFESVEKALKRLDGVVKGD
jgi:tRNA dimethylallyltransferase